MRTPKREQKDLIIPVCEGEAEIMIFNFLKITYSNRKIYFKNPKNLNGISDLGNFKYKYSKLCKELELKPKKDFVNVKILFIIDNDLDDSESIKDFILKENHLIQLCDPNIEGMILGIINKKQTRDTNHDVFRKKCKKNFFNHFNCEAHKLKEVKLKTIFNNLPIIKKYLPTLYNVFTK